MTRTRISVFSIAAGVVMVFTAACTHMLTAEATLPAAHPAEVKGRDISCTECHDPGDVIKGIQKTYGTFNHTPIFTKDHSYYASLGNRGELCSTCHANSFCLDCHATRPAMLPSTKSSNPELEFNHRGDYQTRHRIDG